jgi:endonuclease/exonuclease/phosphatase family metal-dependent hydrolase
MSLPSATAGWVPPPRVETTMRVMTWNLWWRFGPWEARQPAILETIRRVDPDVVCLQEVWESRDGQSQPRDLAGALGFQYVAAAGLGLDIAEESFGNAILSRWPIVGGKARGLPAPEGLDEMRSVLRADIDGPNGPVQVFCTHLNWRLDQSHVRQQQITSIGDFVMASADERTYPPILCGDFNAEPEADEIRRLTGYAAAPAEKLVFLDAWRVGGDGGRGWTWSRLNPFTAADPEPDRRIDYVFVGYPGEEARGEVLSARLEGVEPVCDVQPSDHYGVSAEIRY